MTPVTSTRLAPASPRPVKGLSATSRAELANSPAACRPGDEPPGAGTPFLDSNPSDDPITPDLTLQWLRPQRRCRITRLERAFSPRRHTNLSNQKITLPVAPHRQKRDSLEPMNSLAQARIKTNVSCRRTGPRLHRCRDGSRDRQCRPGRSARD